MRVYLQPPQPSRGLDRIAHALRRYAPPDIEVCEFPRNVDLTVIYAIGRRDRVQRQVDEIRRLGKRYAIVQCCLRSTMSPRTQDWLDIWNEAVVVWSYYNLKTACMVDGFYAALTNFYHAPLGADAQVFRDPFVSPRWATMPNNGRNFTIVTSGESYLSESVRECWLAAKEVEGQVFHVGPVIVQARQMPYISFSAGCRDTELALHYSASQFVSGLRRKEGFELPAVEGLLCGARPVVFDTPDYRWNYGEHAEYIAETDRPGVVDQLVELFKRGARPVTAEERQQAVERFNWETIVKGFWERVR